MYIDDVIDFWFKEIDSKQRFMKSDTFDQEIVRRFSLLHTKASQCELFEWRTEHKGRLAEIIVLDQFSRNIYRNQVKAFSYDSLALSLAQEAIALGVDQHFDSTEKMFLYMPFMHSESKVIHEYALKLFAQNGLESSYQYELQHKVIIDRFNRYPHRNAILGRESSPEELAFLNEPNSSF